MNVNRKQRSVVDPALTLVGQLHVLKKGEPTIRFEKRAGKLAPETLRQMAKELLPAVEAATGWKVDLSKVSLEMVNRKRLFELLTAEHRARMGTDRYSKELPLKAVTGIVMRETGQLLLSEERLKSARGGQVYRVLFHELVHVAQIQRHPDFWAAVNVDEKKILRLAERHGRKSEQVKAVERETEKFAYLFEGHAYMLEKQLAVELPGTKPRLLRTVRDIPIGLKPKNFKIGMRYVSGMSQLEGMGGASAVDDLFENPELVKRRFRTGFN